MIYSLSLSRSTEATRLWVQLRSATLKKATRKWYDVPILDHVLPYIDVERIAPRRNPDAKIFNFHTYWRVYLLKNGGVQRYTTPQYVVRLSRVMMKGEASLKNFATGSPILEVSFAEGFELWCTHVEMLLIQLPEMTNASDSLAVPV